MIDGKSPAQLAGKGKGQPLRILDMACGSGSFLLGGYQYLLDYCLKWYAENGPEKYSKAVWQANGQGVLAADDRRTKTNPDDAHFRGRY